MLTMMKCLLKKISASIVEVREDFHDLNDLYLSDTLGIQLPKR